MTGFGWLMTGISLAVLALAVFAFIDSVARREDAYRAAGKNTKPFWMILLGLTIAVHFLPGGLVFLQIAGLVATIVYLVDVRPALRQVTGRRPRGGGSSSDGPYGPFNGR